MKAFKPTGSIWNQEVDVRANIVSQVCNILEQTYGSPRLGNPEDPLDDLIYILISTRTTQTKTEVIFASVKRQFPEWHDILAGSVEQLEEILRPAGLASKKAGQIIRLLQKLEMDFDVCSLEVLRGEGEEKVHNYLESLPGVSTKVAKCVMLYTLGYQVLPVDRHVHRVGVRLGWTQVKDAKQAHNELEALIPREFRYIFHVGAILHGRAICKAGQPICLSCPLTQHCEYYATLIA